MENSKKILVVDDENDLLIVLEKLLIDRGYKVCIAHNGEEGIEKAKTENPDLVIMDIMMPKVSGGDAVKFLNSDESTQHIPIILLTALTDKSDENQNRATVVIDGKEYPSVAKPYEPVNFLKIIDERLSKTN